MHYLYCRVLVLWRIFQCMLVFRPNRIHGNNVCQDYIINFDHLYIVYIYHHAPQDIQYTYLLYSSFKSWETIQSGAMALDHVKALGAFLEQCKAEENFDLLLQQQFVALKETFGAIGKLTFEDGSALVQRIQEQPWTDEQRKTLVGVIQEKVVANANTTSPQRVSFQNWTNVANYLRETKIHFNRLLFSSYRCI